MYTSFKKFTPKKPVHKFSDLEVYQRTMETSVIVTKDLKPKLIEVGYGFTENMVVCAMALPMWIAEAHSIRFGDHAAAVGLLEKTMVGCNKMVVYFEQIKGIYGSKLDGNLIDDLVKRYQDVRTKIFRLEKSWQKWYEPKK